MSRACSVRAASDLPKPSERGRPGGGEANTGMKNGTNVRTPIYVRTSIFHTLILAFGLASASAVSAFAAEPWSAIISPENSLQFAFVKDTTPVFRLGLGGWGPNWAWVGVGATEK